MRLLSLVLAGVLLLLQVPLWIGKGSWLRVWMVDRQVEEQREVNARLAARNAALDAEVRDLKSGYAAIEERARSELGMIRQDEVFIQVLSASSPQPAARPGDSGRGTITPPATGRGATR
ncbi:MAG: cell division protein FtsB [Pseudomonadota bacterium]|jgi:cell division protein FtsB